MSTEKTRVHAGSEYRSRALDNFDLRAADICKQNAAWQHWPEVLNRIDDTAYVRRENDNIAAHACTRGIFNAGINGTHLLRPGEHSLLVGTDHANALVAQTQTQRAADKSSADDCDLLNHPCESVQCRNAAGSAPRSFGCGGAMRFAVTKMGSISVGMCVSRSSPRCTSGRITANVSSIFFAPA